ncbi:hypothetical protein ACLB2K_073637 [Fragaria x ananassa]
MAATSFYQHSPGLKLKPVLFALAPPNPRLRVSAVSTPPKARFVARRTESVPVPQLQRPLSEYMNLPASQYSVLDAERIERVDDNTFRRSLTLVWYGNAAYMVNQISCGSNESSSSLQQLSSDTVIEVSIEIPFAFRAIPVQAIESSGTQVLEQILKIMLPRFLAQLVKDYQAWASGDRSRQPLGTGEI